MRTKPFIKSVMQIQTRIIQTLVNDFVNLAWKVLYSCSYIACFQGRSSLQIMSLSKKVLNTFFSSLKTILNYSVRTVPVTTVYPSLSQLSGLADNCLLPTVGNFHLMLRKYWFSLSQVNLILHFGLESGPLWSWGVESKKWVIREIISPMFRNTFTDISILCQLQVFDKEFKWP